NRREVEAMKGFAESRGVGFRYDPLLVGGLDGNQELFAQRLSPKKWCWTRWLVEDEGRGYSTSIRMT
ncbi:MAG: hypothetical protein PHQ40_15235, partial [Anaerolineaceae bacterium]|nr:hypothetical protein [Anaerolineaceae bacterium]